MMMVSKLDPRIPRELQAPPPRLVRFRGGRGPRVFGVRIFLLPHLLIGVAVLVLVIGEPLWLFGTPAITATVTSMRMSNARGRTRHQINYIYQWHGQAVSDQSTVSEATYQQLLKDRGIRVHVLSFWGHQFSEIDVTPGQFAAARWFLWPWAFLWNGMMWLVLRQPIVAKRLVSQGQPVVGKILDKETYRGKSTTFNLKYQFTPQSMMAANPIVRRMNVTRTAYDSAEIGKEITVMYDPNRPSRAVIYEYGDYVAG
jgi:hypothetical protein